MAMTSAEKNDPVRFRKALTAAIRNVCRAYDRRSNITHKVDDGESLLQLEAIDAVGDRRAGAVDVVVNDMTYPMPVFRASTIGFPLINAERESAEREQAKLDKAIKASRNIISGYWTATTGYVPIPPKRYEPEPGDECWVVKIERYHYRDGREADHFILAKDKWNDEGPLHWEALKDNRVFKTRDEAKAELFRRQGEGK